VRRQVSPSAVAVLLLVGVVMAGCASPASPSLSPGTFVLPTVTDVGEACAGIGFENETLTGSPTDARVAWLTGPEPGSRLDVVFPPGFTAHFDPNLEILDTADEVVARAGDPVSGGCYMGDGQTLVLWRQP
jgi:hypothetical protein